MYVLYNRIVSVLPLSVNEMCDLFYQYKAVYIFVNIIQFVNYAYMYIEVIHAEHNVAD